MGGYMDNLAGLRLDIVDDPDLIKNSSMPEFLKEAAGKSGVISSKNYPSMSEDDFALIIMTKNGHHIPKFPIHDKVHTWAACESFNKTAHMLPPDARVIAATFIKRACKFYSIPYHKTLDIMAHDDLKDNKFGWNKVANLDNANESIFLSKNVESAAKEMLAEKYAHQYPDSDFGIVTGEKRLYPLFTKELMAESQLQFDKNAEKMAPKFRREFATKIATKLKKTGWPCFVKISSYTGDDFSPELRSAIRTRKGFLINREDQNSYEVLYEKRATLGTEKFAEMLEGLDKHYGLDKQWDIRLQDPYAVTYSHKTAGEYLDTYLWDSGSETISGLSIQKLAEEPSQLAGYLSPDIITAFQRDPIDILPRPQKMLIVRAIKGDLTKLQGQNVQKVASETLSSAKAHVEAWNKSPKDKRLKARLGAKGTYDLYEGDKLRHSYAPRSNTSDPKRPKVVYDKQAGLRGFVDQEVGSEGATASSKSPKKVSAGQRSASPKIDDENNDKPKGNPQHNEGQQEAAESNKVASIEDILNKYAREQGLDQKKKFSPLKYIGGAALLAGGIYGGKRLVQFINKTKSPAIAEAKRLVNALERSAKKLNKLEDENARELAELSAKVKDYAKDQGINLGPKVHDIFDYMPKKSSAQTGAGDLYKPGKMIRTPPMAAGKMKPLMGGRAIKPVIPVGPLTMGV
jgi:hypothetical protein